MANILIVERRKKSATILKTLFTSQGHDVFISDGSIAPEVKISYVITEIWSALPALQSISDRGENPQILYLKNFSRDEYLEQLFNEPGEMQLDQSFKLRDLITVTDGINQKKEQNQESIDQLFENSKDVQHFERNYQSSRSDFLAHIEQDVFSFFAENALMAEVSEETLLKVTFGGLVDYSFDAQQGQQKPEYKITLKVAFDDTRIGISLTSPIYNPSFKSEMFEKLHARIQGKSRSDSELNPTLSRGRGFFVIQSGEHRLSMQLSRLQSEEVSGDWETSILLYRKNKVGLNAARAFSMVVAI
jgi:hypothetical protein